MNEDSSSAMGTIFRQDEDLREIEREELKSILSRTLCTTNEISRNILTQVCSFRALRPDISLLLFFLFSSVHVNALAWVPQKVTRPSPMIPML